MTEYNLGGGRKLKIVYDKDAPAPKVQTAIERWDEWFATTKDEESIKAWNAAKLVHSGNAAMLDNWAAIIELNRLSTTGIQLNAEFVTAASDRLESEGK